MNSSGRPSCPSVPGREILAGVGISLSVVAVLSNATILAIYARYSIVRQPSSTLIASLAVNDSLYALTMIFFITRCLQLHMMHSRVYRFFVFALPFSIEIFAIVHVLIIGLDRTVAVVRPFSYSRVFTARNIKISLGVIWFLLLVLLSLNIGFKLSPRNFMHLPTLFLALGTLRFVFILILVLNYLILLYVGMKTAKRLDKETQMIEAIARRVAIQVQSQPTTVQNNAPNQKRLLRFVTLLIGLFLLFRLPEATLLVIKKAIKVAPLVKETITILSLLNAIINPCLYGLRDPRFHQVFRSWFPYWWSKTSSAVEPFDS